MTQTFELRPFQIEALRLLESHDSVHLICTAPTGSGKSLIFERFGAQKGVRTLLISPLIALARQQVLRLLRQSASATLGAGPEGESPPSGRCDGIWVASPEKLLSRPRSHAMDRLRTWNPNFLVVDECHCVWEWGSDFRPAFSRIPSLVRDLSIPKSLWLTATLPAHAREALIRQLPSTSVRCLGEFALPPGLSLDVRQVPWRYRSNTLVRTVRSLPGAGIVFAFTRESTHRLERLLRAAGEAVVAYHAGMSTEERKALEEQIHRQRPRIIVSTSAFGMGMDYPHLRWTVLWQAPPSLLSLTQGIGRVGRNQNQGQAIVFWDQEDFRLLEWTTHNSASRTNELQTVYRFVTSRECRTAELKRYFDGERRSPSNVRCYRCDTCELEISDSRPLEAEGRTPLPRWQTPEEAPSWGS